MIRGKEWTFDPKNGQKFPLRDPFVIDLGRNSKVDLLTICFNAHTNSIKVSISTVMAGRLSSARKRRFCPFSRQKSLFAPFNPLPDPKQPCDEQTFCVKYPYQQAAWKKWLLSDFSWADQFPVVAMF
jgi:hypothetical protein